MSVEGALEKGHEAEAWRVIVWPAATRIRSEKLQEPPNDDPATRLKLATQETVHEGVTLALEAVPVHADTAAWAIATIDELAVVFGAKYTVPETR